MADIDDDLLALAGDASSDEEDDGLMSISKESSGSPDNKSSGKVSAKKTAAKKTNRRQNDSEEEGEASSGQSSVGSSRSAPMDESDSESDAAPVLFDEVEDAVDRYPLDGKFKNASDKADIMSMPEIRREEILAERATEVERDRQNRALRQMVSGRLAEEGKKDKKRKADTADLEDNQRKTSRQRTKLGGGKVGEASTGIDSLKKARAEKNDRQRRRDADKQHRGGDGRKNNENDDFSEADADGESELDWDDGKTRNKKSKSPDYRDAEPASLIDVERIRVGRTQFALVCFYPGFEEAIKGCFVRVSIGLDKDTNQNVYRLAEIKGFAKSKPYALEAANGKQIKTDQYVIAAHGKAEREWPFITCSNSPFTEAEWQRYKTTCAVENVPIPVKPILINKITDINNLVERKWTDEELQAKLVRSGVLKTKFQPIERNRITNLLAEARKNNDAEAIESLEAKLKDLDGDKLAYSTTMDPTPRKSTGPTQQERLAALNRLNRKKNAQEVRQAQINERRAQKKTEAAIARGEIVDEDFSRRLKTKAKVKHDHVAQGTPGKTDSGASTPAVGTPDPSAEKTSTSIPYLQKLQNEQKKGLPTIRRPLMDDDVIGAIDLGIDIDIDDM